MNGEQGRRLGQSPVAKTDDHAAQVREALDAALAALDSLTARLDDLAEQNDGLYAAVQIVGKDRDLLTARLEQAEARVRLEDAMMRDGIAALEALYRNGHRDKWIAPSVFEAIERAVKGLREALPASDPPAAAPQEREQT